MKIIFRADAALHIGSGHIYRCLTLAHELKSRGVDVTFICRHHTGSLEELIVNQGFAVRMLPPGDSSTVNPDNSKQWLSVAQEIDARECLELLTTISPDWVVVDHYSLDQTWERLIKKSCQNILVIDDLADRKHDCTILLDQNHFANAQDRYSQQAAKNTLLLCGPRYALLKKEFSQKIPVPKKSKSTKNILLYFGTTDRQATAQKAIRALKLCRDLSFKAKILMGTKNPLADVIKGCAGDDVRFEILSHTDGVADLMREADLYVGAGGTITWERLCTGLPGIVIALTDNQHVISPSLADKGYQVYLGLTHNLSETRIQRAIEYVLDSPELLKSMSERGCALVDGRGATRVANLMTHFHLSLRPISPADCNMIYEWCNDPKTRRYSLNPELFSLESHTHWYEETLKNPLRKMLLGYWGETPVGVVRYDLDPLKKTAVVSIYVRPDQHGLGLGYALLYHGNLWLFHHHPEIKNLVAEIHTENHASMELFESLGFKKFFYKYTLQQDPA